MIEIKYKDNFEVSDNVGQSVADVRGHYQKSFHLTAKATAFINGKKITPANEAAATLEKNDRLEFKNTSNHRVAYLVGALLLAMAVTGGVFAYGFTNASTTISVTTSNVNFADVTANTSVPVTWTVHGMQKGQTGPGTLFDISTLASGYPGDLIATISIANIDDLVKVYRNLSLKIELFDSSNNLVDINADGTANATDDFSMLNLNNGSVMLNIKQAATSVYTVKVINGSFITNPGRVSWTPTSGAPMLYCELAQR